MNSLKIKVCGLREPENIAQIKDLGVDYLGHIFCPASPRHVDFLQLPFDFYGDSNSVLVTVDDPVQFIVSYARKFKITILQLHGNESVEDCNLYKSFGFKVIKAISIQATEDFEKCTPYKGVIDYFLFDTKGKYAGGNGTCFNWDLLENYKLSTPFFLSGGIELSHVNALKSLKHPYIYGIDINSGFEDLPGIKNIEQINSFIKELRS